LGEPYAPGVALDDLPVILDRLDALLATDNIRAGDVMRDAASLLRGALGPTAETLERQIASYD